MDVSFGTDSVSAVVVNVPGAHVRLRPHTDTDRVHVHGSVPDVDLDTARSLFDERGISSHQSQGRLHIFGESLSKTAEDWRRRLSHSGTVHFDLRLPPTLDVHAETPGGTVDASGLGGEINLKVMAGTVRLEQIGGPLRVCGSGGSLTVQDSTGALLDLLWSAGDVTLKHLIDSSTTLQARAAPTSVHDVQGPLDLSVHGAPLSLREVDGPCDAQVRGGELTYFGAPTHDTSLTAVGRPLRTKLPAAHAAALTLIGAQVRLDEAFSFTGEQTPQRIEGTLNGGGPKLRLRAVQGLAACRPQ
jgi:hypothetical protein